MSGFRVLGISWIGIGTDRYEETRHLFEDVLGLELDTDAERQCILRTPAGQQVELFGRDGPGKTNNTPPAFALEVDYFDAALAGLVDAGVELVGEAGAWDGHRWQYFLTPDGYLASIKVSPRADSKD